MKFFASILVCSSIIALTVAKGRGNNMQRPAGPKPGPSGFGTGIVDGPGPVLPPKSLCASRATASNCLSKLQNILSTNKTDVSTLVTCEKNVITQLKIDVKSFLAQTGVRFTQDYQARLFKSLIIAGLIGIKGEAALPKLDLASQYVTMLRTVPNLKTSTIDNTFNSLLGEYFKIFDQLMMDFNDLNELIDEAYAKLTTSAKPVIKKPTACTLPANLAALPPIWRAPGNHKDNFDGLLLA
ncbi:hypothetical protein Ciccas_003221 [Cichlidogyrus casuarinus]|uniref:Secreted protein n=1 Tax=Cichlidogyrus casuarinus TaxID=1844966 RepID=A0ABD2QFX2_9PLAT